MPDIFVHVQKQLDRTINNALATVVNDQAEFVLGDIRQHVQIKTSNLLNSYRITQKATPQKLEAVVSSDVDYRDEQYPYQTVFTNPNNRVFTDPPALFAMGEAERDSSIRGNAVNLLRKAL